MKNLVLATFASLLLSSQFSAVSAPPPRLPRFNEVYRVNTHNSYWVKRDNNFEAFASGTQERLLDQLLFDHARSLEIDVHKDNPHPGNWTIYHTDKQSNSLCSPLGECLKQLQQFHYALPRHDPVLVVIELKEILEYNFDRSHRPADFDAILEHYLADSLYRPREFLARCAPGASMRDCARQKGWPTLEELRGKFLFAVLGNWRWCTVGHGGSGWAEYATADGGPRARSAFSMSSDFVDLTHESCGTELVAAEKLQAAYDASVLQQVEESDNAAHLVDVAKFIAEGGIVRGHDAHSE
ncbi:MAG: hypothetical protein HY075_01070, partial [Deltaproteobacteria bacterium]|nr:hypothetical protein [Deltaproteobacteria bacterium]